MSLFISKKMKYFLTVAETLSLTAASEILFVTLGKSIIEIEDEIGMNLFERGHTSLVLTSEGKTLYDALYPLYHQIIHIEKAYKKNEKLHLLFDVNYPDTLKNIYVTQFSTVDCVIVSNITESKFWIDRSKTFVYFLAKKENVQAGLKEYISESVKFSILVFNDSNKMPEICLQNVIRDEDLFISWWERNGGEKDILPKKIVYHENIIHSLQMVYAGEALCVMPEYMLAALGTLDRNKVKIATVNFQEYIYLSSKDKARIDIIERINMLFQTRNCSTYAGNDFVQ